MVFASFILAQQQLALNDSVYVATTALKVRGAPGLNSEHVDSQKTTAKGKIVDASPFYTDGYWWWKVDFEAGVDGWVAEGDGNENFILKLDAVVPVAVEENSTQPSSENSNASDSVSDLPAQLQLEQTGIFLENLRTYWIYDPNVIGGEGLLVPEIRFDLVNRGSRPIEELTLKAVYFLEDGDTRELFGEAENPIICCGNIPLDVGVKTTEWLTNIKGFRETSDTAIAIILGRAPKTTVTLYYKFLYRDDWVKIDSLSVEPRFVR